MERDSIIYRVRTALGRTATDARPEPPPVYFRVPEWDLAEKVRRFTVALEALGGRVHCAQNAESVRAIACEIVGHRTAAASGDPLLRGLPVGAADQVEVGITGAE